MTTFKAAGVLYRASDTGRVLLLMRRADSDHGGTWAFPGGHIDGAETPQEAAARESMEEIGHQPASLTQLESGPDFAAFLCTDQEFIPVLNAESDGYLWASPDKLPDPLHPGVLEMIAVLTKPSEMPVMDKREYDSNGWFERKDNPLSKTGVFPYLGRSIDPSAEPDRMYGVFRPAEELGSLDTIESFKLLPWIDNHVMLGSEEAGLMPAERKGIQGVIGEQVYFNPDDGTLYGNIKLMSQAMMTLIESGKKELSCGYRCTYERSDGITPDGQPYQYIQRNIRGNHLALVDSGRMGPGVAVLDHLDNRKEPAVADTEKKDGESGGLSLEDAKKHLAEIVPMIAQMQKLLGGAGATSGEEDEAEDDKPDDISKPGASEDPTKKEDKQDEKGASGAMDAAEIARQVEARIADKAAMYELVSSHVGAFDHSQMDVAKMADYAVDKLQIKAPADGRVSFVRGYLAAIKAPAASAMDAKSKSAATGSFVSRYLAGSKE